MKIFEKIEADLKSFYSYPDLDSIDKKVSTIQFIKALFDIDFRSIFLYRISSSLINIGMKRMGILIYYRLKSAHALDISPFAHIGPGMKLVHAFNIVIGPNVILGKNCVIFNSVTLGNSHPGWRSNKSLENLMPIIGDRVTICPGARIIGKIKLGDNSYIGANSVVMKNVPAFETWAGAPARMISKLP